MTAGQAWKFFCITGSPVYYLLYKELSEAENASKSA